MADSREQPNKLLRKISGIFKSSRKKEIYIKKDATEFVKKQQALNARIAMPLLWDSFKQGTYVRAKHGKLL